MTDLYCERSTACSCQPLLATPAACMTIEEADVLIDTILKDYVPHPEYLKGYEDGLDRASVALRDARDFDGQAMIEEILVAVRK